MDPMVEGRQERLHMSKLTIGNIVAIISILTSCIGCATVWDYPLPPLSQRTKVEVLKIWGEPNSICIDSSELKYGADEVWIYKNPEPGHPSLREEKLYFKKDIIIKREGVTLDSF